MKITTSKFKCGHVEGISVTFGENQVLLAAEKMPDGQKVVLGEHGNFEKEALSLLPKSYPSLEAYAKEYEQDMKRFFASAEDTSEYI